MTYLFNTMHEKEVKDWYGEIDLEELLQLCYHVTSRADWFVAGMTKASLEYDTQVAIAADRPQDIKLDAFCRVVQRFSEDIRDIKKASTGGTKLNQALSIDPGPSRKIQKISHNNDDQHSTGTTPRD